MIDDFFSIEFGEKEIKIIDLKKNNNNYEINHVGKIDLVNNFYNSDLEKNIEEQKNLIKKIINMLDINKKKVVISINNSLAYHQIIEMPILKEKELISAIKYQADQFIPIPLDDVNVDLEIIKEDEKNKKMLILIVAASKKIIEKIQNTIELTGLIPKAIETNLSSSSRFINYFYKDILSYYKDINDLMIIDFDYFSSTFSYFDEEFLFLKKTHVTSLGYKLFLRDLYVNFNLDEKKSIDFLKNYRLNEQSSYSLEKIFLPIIKEFILEINKFTLSKKPSIIFFTGEIINFPELISLISKMIKDIRIEILNPSIFLKKNSLIESIFKEMPLYLSVIGSSLR